MQFNIFALAALATMAIATPPLNARQANGTVSYTTEVVTSFETYCPSATTLTYNNQTYVATGATTLTVTNCPCTLTKPAGGEASSSPVGDVSPAAGATSATATPVSVTASTTGVPASQFTGAADIQKPAFGMLILGALGAVALL